jgi:hypothetical protein
MGGLAELLGQDETAEQIWGCLRDPEVQILRLTGPSGSGKSFIARTVSKTWCEAGGRCVVAVGDDENSWRELFPLLTGLSSSHQDWTGLATTATRSAIRVAETAVGSPGAAVSIFDLLGAAFRQRTTRALRPYSDGERAIILDLNTLGRSHDLLLVADNAHWWDVDSLRLLRALLSKQLREGVPSLQSVVVLLVDTAEEQSTVAPEEFEALVAMCEERTYRTRRCSRDDFPTLLRAFGFDRELPDKVLGSLFDVTRGHLKLVEQVAAYAEEVGDGELLASLDGEYLTSLVHARFASLGISRREITTLLVRAAVLGLSFTARDLECISEQKRAEVGSLVEMATKIGFVERKEEEISFSHEVIRTAVLWEQTPQHLRPVYEKLAQCLTILRPGDYAARARALLEAENYDSAREMIALSGVSQIRRGVPPGRVLRRIADQAPSDADLQAFMKIVIDGYAAVEAGDFASAIPSLSTPGAGESLHMAAERNYLAAICWMELQTTASALDALTTLESWIPRLEEEPELAIRFLVLVQQAQVLANKVEEARQTESRIEQQLSERSGYDAHARAMLQIQNRRAAAVNSPEVAQFRIAEAADFFRRGTGDDARDRLELFRSLSNLTSIEIRLGEYENAFELAREAERLAAEAPNSVHRLDVFASNFVLAAYRTGAIDLKEAVTRQQQIVDSPEGSGDKLLQRCNLAGFLILAGRDQEALLNLDELEDEIGEGDFDESYLLFYLYSTAVAGAAFRGDLDEARRRHADKDEFVEGLTWPGAPYVRRRHQRVSELLPSFECDGRRSEMDEVFLRRRKPEIGPAWCYYGRLLPLCSLNFWSDS